MIRFHLDQHVANAVAHGLRLRGIDVSTTHDSRLQDADDLAHIAYAQAEGRVIFTQDDDFLRHHHAGVPHAGIVYSKQGTRSIGDITRYLKLMHDCLEMEDMVTSEEYRHVGDTSVNLLRVLRCAVALKQEVQRAEQVGGHPNIFTARLPRLTLRPRRAS